MRRTRKMEKMRTPAEWPSALMRSDAFTTNDITRGEENSLWAGGGGLGSVVS
jgi:hypothetical protein